VWSLLDAAYQRVGPVPTCIERDFNISSLAELVGEVKQAAEIMNCYAAIHPHARAAS